MELGCVPQMPMLSTSSRLGILGILAVIHLTSAGYDLIDENPACTTGNTYQCGAFCACGSDSATLCGSDSAGIVHPLWLERVQFSMVNAARTGPAEYDAHFNGVWRSWSTNCDTPTLPPVWWSSGLTQSARWHSWEQAITNGCACTHDTCPDKTNYFADMKAYSARLQSFDIEGGLVFYGENVNTGYGSPQRSLWLGWFQSPGHCGNIFSDTWNIMGTGYYYGLANERYRPNGHFWTQNFGQVQNPPSHEIPSGSHIENEADQTLVHFFATFFSASGTAPSSAQVIIDGTAHKLALFTGSAAAGSYYVDIDKSAWSGCKSYYFQFGLTRLPESDCYSYRTYGIAGCEEDFSSSCGASAASDFTCADTTSSFVRVTTAHNCSAASNSTHTCEGLTGNSVCKAAVDDLFTATTMKQSGLCASSRPYGCFVSAVDETASSADWYWNYGQNCKGDVTASCSDTRQCVCLCHQVAGSNSGAQSADQTETSDGVIAPSPSPSGDTVSVLSPSPSSAPSPSPSPSPSASPSPSSIPTPSTSANPEVGNTSDISFVSGVASSSVVMNRFAVLIFLSALFLFGIANSRH